MDKEQVKGAVDNAVGKTKEVIEQMFGDKQLDSEVTGAGANVAPSKHYDDWEAISMDSSQLLLDVDLTGLLSNLRISDIYCDAAVCRECRACVLSRIPSYLLLNSSSSGSESFSTSIILFLALSTAWISSFNFKWMARASRFCVFCMTNTMRNVTIVGPVLMINCQVLE